MKARDNLAGILNAENRSRRLDSSQKNNIDLSNVKGKGQKTLNSRRKKDCKDEELGYIEAPLKGLADPFLEVCFGDPPQEATGLFNYQAALC